MRQDAANEILLTSACRTVGLEIGNASAALSSYSSYLGAAMNKKSDHGSKIFPMGSNKSVL